MKNAALFVAGAICILLAVVSALVAQSGPTPAGNAMPSIASVRFAPSEDIPTTGTCTSSTGGFLSIGGTQLPNNMNDADLGKMVKKGIRDGYSLELFPQSSGRIFVLMDCHAKTR